MAEMAVSLARNKLIPLLSDEAKLVWDIPNEFADIKKELEYIQDFLKDADTRAAEGGNANEGIKTWVKELREASFRIEDVIDEYMILVEQQPHDPGCAALLCQIIHLIETLMPRHRIASEIQQIKSVVDRIKQGGRDYNFLRQPFSEQGQSSNRGSQRVQRIDPRSYSPHLDEAQVVGFEDPRDELIGWLVEGPVERIVISVVGMGGLGKTTLAGRVFNSKEVIAHFGGRRAWITVSQSYTVEGLLRDVLEKMCREIKEEPPKGISNMDLHSLIVEVKKYLQPKKYFVIFDDVWSEDLSGLLENTMPRNENGSRILITTRSQKVVNSCKKSPFDQVHELKLLTPEKSMELFCKKAFPAPGNNNGHCPEDLLDISSNFVDKCRGLPLAIVAIGSLLSSKEKTPREWRKIWQRLSSEMEKNPDLIPIQKILGFSYDDLPYHLKPCFLYFGMYPDDYEVQQTRLIRQWIAEGFVEEEQGKAKEDTAQQYLTELIGRSLVQVSKFSVDGRPKRFHVHDLLHEMILRKCKDLSFCQHIVKKDEPMSSGMIRRLSIRAISNDLMGNTESSHTRSLLVFARERSTSAANNFVQRIPTKYRLLKVLDFEDSPVREDFKCSPLSHVFENWGNLVHLKYLNLRFSNLPTQLLKFMGELQNLETLDIRLTGVYEMPKEICKLRKLRHLLGDDLTLFQMKNGLEGMASLQTLCQVDMCGDEVDGLELIIKLGKLKHLRKLSLRNVKEGQGSALCSSINEMTNLEKLLIHSAGEGLEFVNFPVISSSSMLQKLCLDGKLKKFPEWVPHLQSLVKLYLRNSELTDDPLKSLQNMPNLLVLHLNNAYEGDILHFQDGGFQKLKQLSLGPFYSLKSIIINEGALVSLEFLQFYRIDELKTVPLGIQHLKKLDSLDIFRMSDEFNDCIAPDGGPKHLAIQHVPLVRITDNRRRRRIIRH